MNSLNEQVYKMYVVKKELLLGSWAINFVVENEDLSFTVAFADNSNVSCIEEISSTDEDFGERYTSQSIEDNYKEHGSPMDVSTSIESFSLGAYVFSIYVDEDYHLNLLVQHEENHLPVNNQGEDENPAPVITRNFKMSGDQSYTVTVPVYGFIEIDVDGVSSQKEAEEKAMEDCMNLRVDSSELELAQNSHVELLPYEKIIDGFTSYVTHPKIKSERTDED